MSRRPLHVALAGTLLAAGLAIAAPGAPVGAAGSASIGAFGVPVTENFDSLANSGSSSTTPTGWNFAESGTSAANNGLYTAGTGSGNGGDTYSFGAASSTERAFGGLLSGTLTPTIGASYTNDTGSPITQLAISYTGEQWRLGATGRADRLDFQISTDATSLSTGTWTDADSLDFSSPITAGATGALDGNAGANRTAVASTLTGLSIAPGATFWIRWNDFNATSSDDGLAVDEFSLTAVLVVTDAAPAVVSTAPADGATNVSPNQRLTVNFSEPVTVTDPWYTLSCSTSGAIASTYAGGPTAFTIDPTGYLPYGESCTLTVLASGVADVDLVDPPNNPTLDFTVGVATAPDRCAEPYTSIGSIQGSGAATPLSGTVTTQGVVIADYEGASPALRGFYIQDLLPDSDPATSEGLFVFEGSNEDTVSVGDVVRVTGTVGENQGQTQISVGSIGPCGTATVEPTDITFPVAAADSLEAVEGMLVRLPQTMYVTEHFQLGRFGQVVLSADGRLQQPTSIVAPGAPANAQQAANNLNKIILDDGSQTQNPDPIVWGRNGLPLTASNTLRGGDTATGIVGVMTYTWAGNSASGNAYRVRPIGSLGGTAQFVAINERPTAPPAVGGDVQVVGMNLLNYFNTFGSACTLGTTGGTTACRGASDQGEFDRQNAKTVAAILALDPDVLGVNEIENDGYGPTSALADLVDRLNAATAPGTYAFIDVDANTGQIDAMGGDAIRVAQIYKPGVVTPVGDTAVLNTAAFVNGGDAVARSRPTVAQAYEVNATGAVFIVDVNHLKSKGSACTAPDAGDGQGNCNIVRTAAATELVNWLATDPTGTGDTDVLLVGDYNSYAMEDPITVIRNAGFTNLIEQFLGADAYSYVFDGQWGYLDHALASSSLVSQVNGVGDYHINADEPSVLDYLNDFKSANQLNILYAPDQYRVSDHDPVIVGLTPNAPPTVDAGGPYTVAEGGTVTLTAAGSDPNVADVLTYEWDLDNDGTFETAGQSVTFSAAAIDGPATRTVQVRATDPGSMSATDTATVDITNAAPAVTAAFTAERTECGASNATLDVSWSDTSADTHTVVIDWGDGTSATVSAATSPLSLAHTYTRARTYTATVTVTDDDGGATVATDTMSVNFLTTGILPPIKANGSSVFKRGSTVPVSVLLVDCNLSVPSSLAPVLTVTKVGNTTPDVTLSMNYLALYFTLLRTNQLSDPSGTYVATITVPRNGQTISATFKLRP